MPNTRTVIHPAARSPAGRSGTAIRRRCHLGSRRASAQPRRVLHVRRRRHGGRRSRLHSLRRTDAQHLFIAGAGLPPFGLGGQPPAGPLGRIRDLVVTKSVQRQWNKGRDRINEFRIPHRWRAATPCLPGWRVCPRWIRRGWRSAVRARAMGWPLPWPCWPGTAARSRLRCRCWCIPCSTTGQRRGKGSTTGQRRGGLDHPGHRMWNQASNRFGWASYLGGADPDVAVPARHENLTGLPPAWMGVRDSGSFPRRGPRLCRAP